MHISSIPKCLLVHGQVTQFDILINVFYITIICDIMKGIDYLLNHKEFYIGDDIQRRYEMIRAWKVDGSTQKEAAKAFNYSLPNFKRIWKRFKEEGMSGLMNKRPGPQSRRESTESVIEKIIQFRKQDMNIYEIADTITKEGNPISYGTVNRVLKEEGYLKKTREKKQT